MRYINVIHQCYKVFCNNVRFFAIMLEGFLQRYKDSYNVTGIFTILHRFLQSFIRSFIDFHDVTTFFQCSKYFYNVPKTFALSKLEKTGVDKGNTACYGVINSRILRVLATLFGN